MSIIDNLDWDLGWDDSSGSSTLSKRDSKSLGGYKRWSSASDRSATTKESKGKEFLSRFKKNFKDKFRDSR